MSIAAHPVGVEVRTFLFTDIEGSTRAWEADPETMSSTLERHDAIVRRQIAAAGGEVFKHTGDGVASAFVEPSSAVRAAVDIQRELGRSLPGLRARVALHLGDATSRDGDWFGRGPNRVARLLAASAGGEILLSEGVKDRASLSAEVEIEDLGVHRLRDVAEGIRIFRLHHPDLPATRRPLRSLEALLTNLPTPTSSFVGRDDDVAHIGDLLASNRLVTLTGPGGVGKTRVALRLGEDQLRRQPDGVWVCELSSVLDGTQVPVVMANALGLVAEGSTAEKRLVEGLRRKRCLLVVDNCEHLIDPVAKLVDRIHRDCPLVSVLTTGRAPLGVEGETVVRLDPLDTSHLGAPAIDLFVDRARAARHDFALDAENEDAVVSICRHLDGLPLAIELAASRIRAMSPSDLERRLDDRFQLLGSAAADALGRRRTLESVVDWSYGLCSSDEQQVFERLSAFAPGFSLESAEAVCSGAGLDPSSIASHLASLVDRSMVLADVSAAETRFVILETLQAFGRRRLRRSGGEGTCRRRHAEHYVELLAAIADDLHGRGEVEAARRLDLELENLRTAVTWSVREQQVDLAMVAASHLAYPSYEMQRLEALSWCEHALAVRGAREHRRFPAVAGIVALGHGQLRDWHGGLELADAALDAVADGTGEPSVWPHLARVQIALWSGQVLEAAAWVRELVQVSRALGDPWAEARSLGLQAWVSAITEPDRAADDAAVALEAARRSANPSVRSFVLWDAAQVHLHAGAVESSLEAATQAAEAAEPTSNRVAKGVALQLTMSLYDLLGDERGRWRCARDALRLLRVEGTTTTLAGITLLQVIEGFGRLGRADLVERFLAQASAQERALIATLDAQVPHVVAVLEAGTGGHRTESDAELASQLIEEIDAVLDALGDDSRTSMPV